MKITELLQPVGISLGQAAGTKDEIIHRLADLMEKTGALTDKAQYIEDLKIREASGTTGIGEGIAIPHAKSKGVSKPQLVSMTVPNGTNYESLDGTPTNLFFMIAVPENSNDEHLKVLSRLSTMLMDESFRNALLKATDKTTFLNTINQKEAEKFPEDFQGVLGKDTNTGYDIVAVTGCPTGIAHTYMAAEGIINKAKEMGYNVKVETHGSTGIENALTTAEIANAKGVIIAADVAVDKSRFNGKRLVDTKVSDGINKPAELINRVLDESRPVYQATGQATAATEEDSNLTVGQKFYKHLMNGVSHMLPFVVGGGILIAVAFLLDDYTIDPSSFGSNTPLAAFFNQIGGAAFSFMLPVLAGYIGMSIADRPGLMVGMVGGYLANTGGAGFLGALAAGFIAGYLILLLRKVTEPLPRSMDGVKPMLIFPVFGILGIGAIMLLLLNPPLAQLNTMITDGLNNMGNSSKLLLGALLGAMMAVDMGGPVNKAAYVFGTASLASGSSAVMAAVMAGGMVPPLAISLSMLLFKNKYTEKDRQAIPTNIIMGMSFITEGAIPFAAADPLRVIPAMVVGSGLAGLLSMLFGCSLRAPHGGIWVIGVVENPVMYLVAVIAGAIVGAFILGTLKKNINE
ncbi:PTS fructose transporter subunit IIABC [Globicatella sanguinis]|uniref:PTS fructose transporter subunit IIABC n=1 Tax=Globicatella sanguinis TaxID=13076 RepID=UPI000824A433|nr:fructose-specific PTS transporter subunit EIIC [Globicatella sanguinis]MDK7631172.1 fructose-specific PTS transporter subunit EIIC [Globicatella sanguinis]WIK67425.1 fructose-specific PTS transporter subunit EIIC [Globicatella sanguinis]WKT56830.1 fructose-specific PTS transporter subunit EIIC [Globicatella sanguinis]